MSKPTRVEKEVLLALLELGRRKTHTANEITWKRLQMRHGWDEPKPPHRMMNNERAQYQRATEKWLHSFWHRGLVIIEHERAKAGKKLQLLIGPFFKLSAVGHEYAKELKRG